MPIDPVVLLIEDLCSTEAALDTAAQLYARERRRTDGELVSLLLGRVKRIFSELHETVPTSAIGAAELVRLAAKRLPFSYSRYATHLHGIADRLAMGRREHTDLVWLRALQAALIDGVCGESGDAVAPWLTLAVIGASRPIIVFRAVQPVTGNPPWKNVLPYMDGTHDVASLPPPV